MQDPSEVRRMMRVARRAFTSSGFQLTPPAADVVCKFLADNAESADATQLARALQSALPAGQGTVVDVDAVRAARAQLRKHLQKATQESSVAGSQLSQMSFNRALTLEEGSKSISIVSAFDVPRMVWNDARQRFHRDSASSSQNTGDVGDVLDRTRMFLDRYEALWQRCVRHPLFVGSVLVRGVRAQAPGKEVDLSRRISQVISLMGNATGERWIFGMLNEVEGNLVCEDTSGYVKLDVSSVEKKDKCLFTWGNFVLLRGRMSVDPNDAGIEGTSVSAISGVFHVAEIRMPPTESRFDSIERCPDLDPLRRSAAELKELRRLERNSVDCIAVASDVHLDDDKCVRRLRKMLNGLRDACLVCLVLCGNFSKSPYRYGVVGERERYKKLFDTLAEVLETADVAPTVRSCKVVLVPGPSDPHLSGEPLPWRPLLSPFLRRVRNSVIASSMPCRLRWMTREFVVVRDNTIDCLRRASLFHVEETEDQDVLPLVASTILRQMHVSPVSTRIKPVWWKHDKGAIGCLPF
ncbi:MAG: hypothetical protein MHM6MM_002471 [Cercozoa sp. M6MM]